MLNTGVIGPDGRIIEGRMELAPDVWLGYLDAGEASRVSQAVGMRYPVQGYRLELHNVKVAYDPGVSRVDLRPGSHVSDFIDIRPLQTVERLLGLLSLAVRMAPLWPSVVYDRLVEGTWVRDQIAPAYGGFPPYRYSYLPLSRIETWKRLIQNWPHHMSETIDQSLSFYYQSVVDRPESPAKSLTSAAIAFESLLGRGLTTELRHRLSQRAAMLVARGAEAKTLYGFVRGWYDIRSSLVHDAKHPDPEVPVRFDQFLMRAIPSMARLSELVGSHSKAVQVLDDALFERAPELDRLFDETGWWNYVDVLEAFKRPPF